DIMLANVEIAQELTRQDRMADFPTGTQTAQIRERDQRALDLLRRSLYDPNSNFNRDATLDIPETIRLHCQLFQGDANLSTDLTDPNVQREILQAMQERLTELRGQIANHETELFNQDLSEADRERHERERTRCEAELDLLNRYIREAGMRGGDRPVL